MESTAVRLPGAAEYESRYEKTHMTQIFCDKFEEIGKAHHLEFHYELHYNEREKFIRLCCHIAPYGNHKNYKTKADMFNKLQEEGLENLVQVRKRLAQEFKKEFADTDCEFIGNRYNYFGLIKRKITAETYEDAIKQSELFIDDTYDQAYRVISEVLSV